MSNPSQATETTGYGATTSANGAMRAGFPQKKAFVLQFSGDAGPLTGLFRGRVEHVLSGEQASFESPEDLWSFVRLMLVRSDARQEALPPMRAAG